MRLVRPFLTVRLLPFLTAHALAMDVFGPVPVVRVVDGDTFIALVDGREEYVRMLNIDTPAAVPPDQARNEAAGPYGKMASDNAKSLLRGNAPTPGSTSSSTNSTAAS